MRAKILLDVEYDKTTGDITLNSFQQLNADDPIPGSKVKTKPVLNRLERLLLFTVAASYISLSFYALFVALTH